MTIESVRVREFVLEMMPQGGICAEIGVLHGQYTDRILAITNPRKLFLIDPWLFELYKTKQELEDQVSGLIGQDNRDERYITVCKKFKREIVAGKVVIIRTKSSFACRLFDRHFFDWIYIDGDHTVAGALADLRNYVSLVKSGGFVAGDDFDRPPFGVTEAVEIFMQDDVCDVVSIVDHQFILRKK